jgi:hypothetical protein
VKVCFTSTRAAYFEMRFIKGQTRQKQSHCEGAGRNGRLHFECLRKFYALTYTVAASKLKSSVKHVIIIIIFINCNCVDTRCSGHLTYYMCTDYEGDYSRFSWGGLHGKHIVATWK